MSLSYRFYLLKLNYTCEYVTHVYEYDRRGYNEYTNMNVTFSLNLKGTHP